MPPCSTETLDRLLRLARRDVTVFDGAAPEETAITARAMTFEVDVATDATYYTLKLKIRCPHPREVEEPKAGR